MTKESFKKVKILFPEKLIAPVRRFLSDQIKLLELRRKNIEEEDPFSNPERAKDNAAIDTEAEEQFGHATATALKEQIDRKIIQTRKALSRAKMGKYGICSRCGNMINTDRLMVYPEATFCVKCEKKREIKQK